MTVAGLTALSAVLTFYCIACESFWIDEGQSWHYAQRSGTAFLRALRVDPSMPLYYVVLHFWLGLGNGEAFVRSLSAFLTVASVPLIYLIGRELLDVQTAVLAALLLAINQFAVAFGQEARGYALTQFLVVLSTYLLTRAMVTGSRRLWAAYALVAVLTVSSHAFALYVLLAHLAIFLVTRKEDVPWKRIGIFAALIAGLGATLLLGPLGTATRRYRFFWIQTPTVDRVLEGIGALTGQATGWYTLPYLVLVLLGAAFLILRVRAGDTGPRWRALLPLAWVTIPLIGSLAASWWIPMFVPRYLIVVLPALVLLAAYAVRAMPNGAISLACLVILLGIGTQTLNLHYRVRQKEGWRQATRVIVNNARPDDDIIFVAPSGVAPYAYYRAVMGVPDAGPPEIAYPSYDPDIQDFDRRAIPELVAAIPGFSGRVWLVTAYEWLGPRSRNAAALIRATLRQHHALVSHRTVLGINIRIYETST